MSTKEKLDRALMHFMWAALSIFPITTWSKWLFDVLETGDGVLLFWYLWLAIITYSIFIYAWLKAVDFFASNHS